MAAITMLTRRDLTNALRVSIRTLDRLRAGGLASDPLPGPGQPRSVADDVAA